MSMDDVKGIHRVCSRRIMLWPHTHSARWIRELFLTAALLTCRKLSSMDPLQWLSQMTARTKNCSTISKYGIFGRLNIFRFFCLLFVFTIKGITQRRALEKWNNMVRSLFHYRLGENKMNLGKSRWGLVIYSLHLK